MKRNIIGIVSLFLVLLCVLISSNCLSGMAEEVVELEPIIITPWRAKDLISDVSRSVTIITEKEIKSSNANFLPELIQSYSGIVVSDYLGNSKGTVVDIRGFGESSTSNVLVLVDGRRTNQVDLSGVDWGQIDLNSIERIEIVKGPSTVLYGDNAAAGVINIITKRGEGRKPTIEVGGEFGSYENKKGFASVGGNTELMDYFISCAYQENEGYRENNYYQATDYFGRITIYPSEVFEMDLSSGYHKDSYGMPGSLYQAHINSIGRRGTRFPDDNGLTSDFFVLAEPKLILSLDNVDVMFSIFSTFRDRRSEGLSVMPAWGWEGETNHHIRTYELRPKLEVAVVWWEIMNKIKMGIDYFYANDRIISGNRIGSQQDYAKVRKQTLAVYVHDSFKLFNKFLVNTGFRGEWADYLFNQTLQFSNKDTKKMREAAFNIGFGYKYLKNSQLYFDFSRSYRFPNTEEYYTNKYMYLGTLRGGLNTDIKPQIANNYEIGIRELSFKGLNVGTNFFLMDVKNEIFFDPALPSGNSNYDPLVRHYGFELEGNLELLGGALRPFGHFTLQKSYFKGGKYADKQVPLVPNIKLSTGFTISPIDNFNWTFSSNYVGDRYLVSDQNNIAPMLGDYIVFNTTADYYYKGVTIWGAVKNLFDERYHVFGVSNNAGVETFYPASGISFEFGASYKF